MLRVIVILILIPLLLYLLLSSNRRNVYYCGTDYLLRNDMSYMLRYFDRSTERGVGYKPLIPGGSTMTFDLQLGKNSDTVKNIYTSQIQPFVNLKFDFNSKGPNVCKVIEIKGSISYGTASTIQYGSSSGYANTPGIVIHECCHAMQMMHELQNPKRDIKFIESAVIAYYKQLAGWDEATTRKWVLSTLPESSVIANDFDRKSVMLYTVPGKLIEGGVGVSQGQELSKLDKEWLAKVYGPPPTVMNRLLYSLRSFQRATQKRNNRIGYL